MTKNDDTQPATAHTPDPWTEEYLPYISGTGTDIPCYRIHSYDAPEEYICETSEHLDEEVQYANARRIVSAVNACQGLSTEALEQGVVHELLEALSDLINQLTAVGIVSQDQDEGQWHGTEGLSFAKARAALVAARAV